MGTIVVGDLHLKQSRVLPLVDTALEQTGAGRVVLCGDFTDDWGSTDADELQELAVMNLWASECRRTGTQVDLLMGNHDFAYFTGHGNAGTHTWITPEVRRLLTEAGIALATNVGDILVTHAGLTRAWAQRSLGARAEGRTDPEGAGEDARGDAGEARAEQLAAALNEWFASGNHELWAELDEVGRARGGRGLPGPLWADASELAADPLPGLRQIVGHTPMLTCTRLPEEGRRRRLPGAPRRPADSDGAAELPELWACDTFSTYHSGAPIGDGSLLLVDDAGLVSVLPTAYTE